MRLFGDFLLDHVEVAGIGRGQSLPETLDGLQDAADTLPLALETIADRASSGGNLLVQKDDSPLQLLLRLVKFHQGLLITALLRPFEHLPEQGVGLVRLVIPVRFGVSQRLLGEEDE